MGFRVFKIPTNTKPDIVCPIIDIAKKVALFI